MASPSGKAATIKTRRMIMKQTSITVADCKKLTTMLRDAKRDDDDPKRHRWHKFGVIAILASDKSTSGHSFYFRVGESKSYKTMKIRAKDLRDNGGDLSLDDIVSRAVSLSHGTTATPVRSVNGKPTLETCLKIRLAGRSHKLNDDTLRSGDDIDREIRLYGRDWLAVDVRDITEQMVGTRLREIVAGEYPHPDKTGVTLGSRNVADKFARYLRLVLVGTSDLHGIKIDGNPVSDVQRNVIGKVEARRPATAIFDHEIKALIGVTRSKCCHDQSQAFNVEVWRGVLAMKLALFSAYRIGDIANLRDDNIGDGVIIKKKGDAQKSARGHRLPMTNQIRVIIEECRLIRDRDFESLRSRFKWTKKEIADFENFAGVYMTGESTPLIFPKLRNGFGEYKNGQRSQLTRAARDHLVKRGIIKAEQRFDDHGDAFQKDGEDHPDVMTNHDLRATFITKAMPAKVDPFSTALLSNHDIEKAAPAMTRKYMSVSNDEFVEMLGEAITKIDDHLEAIALI